MKEQKNTVKAVDFFCGGGGMSYGMQKAGIKILAGIDYEKNCEATYKANIKGAEFIEADVFKLTEKELEEKLELQKPNEGDNIEVMIDGHKQFEGVLVRD